MNNPDIDRPGIDEGLLGGLAPKIQREVRRHGIRHDMWGKYLGEHGTMFLPGGYRCTLNVGEYNAFVLWAKDQEVYKRYRLLRDSLYTKQAGILYSGDSTVLAPDGVTSGSRSNSDELLAAEREVFLMSEKWVHARIEEMVEAEVEFQEECASEVEDA